MLSRHVIRVSDALWQVTIERDPVDGGFIVSCPELKGCHSQGDNAAEALENIRNAIAAWLSEERKR